jgi:hypothetical protein
MPGSVRTTPDHMPSVATACWRSMPGVAGPGVRSPGVTTTIPCRSAMPASLRWTRPSEAILRRTARWPVIADPPLDLGGRGRPVTVNEASPQVSPWTGPDCHRP